VFQGTIPPPLRSIVHEHAGTWPAGDVYIGCSGNLTLERTLAPLGRQVHSNDVNPYSCALGWYFSGQPLDYRLKDDSREALGWLEPSLDGGVGTLATLMLGTRWLDWVGRTTPYHQRMVAAYQQQWPQMHAGTVAKLGEVTLRLASFYPGDVRDYLTEVPEDSPVCMFPPFWAAGYKVMFRGIETHFDWPEPQFTNLDDDGKQEIIDLVVDRPNWLLGLHYLDETLEPFRVGYVQPTPRAVPIWVYARPGRARIAGPRQKVEPVLIPKIGPEDELGDRLSLHPLTPGQFNALRSMYLDTRITPGSPMIAVGVVCGGKLIGAFGYNPASYDPEAAYLMSDFPIGWSRYKRLAKLIVMAALSVEAQHLLQRMRSHRTTRWSTTAFTDNPTSGKYGRGIPGVRLNSRKPCTTSDHTWQLDYGGPLGQWTLAEALAMWKARNAAARRDTSGSTVANANQ
jgi:hypothetical protein